MNGVAAHPWRLRQVEDAIRGKPRNDATAQLGESWPSRARRLCGNAYKIPLGNLVRRAIRGSKI